MKLAFASDHRGYKLKIDLINKVKEELGYECVDCGCDSEIKCDFPIYAFKASELVANNQVNYGIVICGSGDGMCVASNKVKGIRCTLVVNEMDATRAKAHINANVLALGSEKTNLDEAFKIVKALVNTEFLKHRYELRCDMISKYEKEH
jgi:ribose 5-phosphate isomerase B